MRCFALAAASFGLVVLGTQSMPVAAQTDMAQTDAPQANAPQADTTGTLPVVAKPADFASKEEEAGIEQSFVLLRDALAEDEVAQPAQAIAQYEAFFNEKGKRSIRVGIEISSLIAKLYWLGLHQPQKAQATYDWAIATYRNQPGFERLYLEEQLLQNPKSLDVSQVKVTPNLKAPLVPDAVRVASVPVAAQAPLAVATVRVGQAPTQGGKVEVAGVGAMPEVNRIQSVEVKTVAVGGVPVAFGVPLVAKVTMPKVTSETPNRVPVAQVGGTQTATTTRRTSVGTVKAPADAARSKVPEVAAVGGETALLAALVEQMRAGVLTPEEAWKKGSLTIDDAMRVLDNTGDWLVGEAKNSRELYRDLAKLIVDKGGDKLKDLSHVPPKVRIWLADYFQGKEDARAVQVAESILNEVKTPFKAESPLLFQAFERIAWYYRDIGQLEKSADTWLWLNKESKDHTWQKYDALYQEIMTRVTADLPEKKSVDLLKASLRYSDDYMVQNALAGFVSIMLTRGKMSQVLALLNDTSVSGSQFSSIRTLVLCLRGKVALLQGNEDQARSDWQKAASSIENSPAGSRAWVLSQETLQVELEHLALFRDSPFLIQSDSVQLEVGRQPAAIVEVDSIRQNELSVSTTQKGVRLEVGEWHLKLGSSSFTRNIEVYAETDAALPDFTLSVQDKATTKTHDVYVTTSHETEELPDVDVW